MARRLQSGDWQDPFALQPWYPLWLLAKHPATFHSSLPGGKKQNALCESWGVTLGGGKGARKTEKCWASVRSASNRLQTAPGLHWDKNAEHSLLPDTAKRKKKKLAKGSQTKQSTCSMNFWALVWELDHVAYRTIIRKGVSRLIIKELRAYQPWVADVLRAINGVKKSSGELWRNPAKTHAQTHLITKYVYMTSMSDSSVF